MNKEIPCATCSDICENAIGLYTASLLAKEYTETNEAEITSQGLYCHKTKLWYELTLKEIAK